MAMSSSFGDTSLEDAIDSFSQNQEGEVSGHAKLDVNGVESIAEKLIEGNLYLTALELHAELQEIGIELPKLRQFFSNPANVEKREKVEQASLVRSPSQQTFDSIDFDRVSEVNNNEQDRVAVLEYELRKAKETIKRLRENVTAHNVSSTDQPPPGLESTSSEHVSGIDDANITNRPMEALEKRAISFLVNEFVLKCNCKMTAVTFAEENTDQDFDDWDDVGINTARPPSLIQLYRKFLNYRMVSQKNTNSMKDAETNTEEVQEDPQVASPPPNSPIPTIDNEIHEEKIREMEDKIRKGKQDSDREISRLMFENERLTEELNRVKKSISQANMRSDVSMYSIASTVIGEEPENDTPVSHQPLKVTADPCSHLPKSLTTKVLSFLDQRPRAMTGNQSTDDKRVYVDLENMQSSFSPYDCSRSWKLYSSVKKFMPNEMLEEIVPFLVSLMLRTDGDLREEITKELLSLFGNRCELRQIKIIVAALLTYAYLANIQEVQSHLLAVCWEQINSREISKRLIVAMLCGPLACHLEAQIRSSLLFSILQQLITDDKDATVRMAALDSLVEALRKFACSVYSR